jgi:hypothetical protein
MGRWSYSLFLVFLKRRITMMNIMRSLCLVIITAVLSACGGGGGGGLVTPATPVQPAQPIVTLKAGPVAIKTPTVNGVVTQQFSGSLTGALDQDGFKAILWQGAIGTGTLIAGTSTLSTDGMTTTFIPTVRLPLGQTYTLEVTGKDLVGRSVDTSTPFTMPAMTCVDNAVWSNPALFSTAYQDCIGPIGVQALSNLTMNTVQDSSCVITVGTALSAPCKVYMANGTMLLADTGTLVNASDPTVWMTYFTPDGSSNIVLLDVQDPSNPMTVAKLVLPEFTISEIGNPTGENDYIATASNGTKEEQLSWNGTSIAMNP